MPRFAAFAGWLRHTFNFLNGPAADITGTGALAMETWTPGYQCIIEEFGYRQLVVATGTPASVYQLKDAAGNVIAQLTLTAANVVTAHARGDTASTSAITASGDGIREAFKEIRDGTVVSLVRVTGGTGAGAGQGNFYVKYRQRPQQL